MVTRPVFRVEVSPLRMVVGFEQIPPQLPGGHRDKRVKEMCVLYTVFASQ